MIVTTRIPVLCNFSSYICSKALAIFWTSFRLFSPTQNLWFGWRQVVLCQVLKRFWMLLLLVQTMFAKFRCFREREKRPVIPSEEGRFCNSSEKFPRFPFLFRMWIHTVLQKAGRHPQSTQKLATALCFELRTFTPPFLLHCSFLTKAWNSKSTGAVLRNVMFSPVWFMRRWTNSHASGNCLTCELCARWYTLPNALSSYRKSGVEY